MIPSASHNLIKSRNGEKEVVEEHADRPGLPDYWCLVVVEMRPDGGMVRSRLSWLAGREAIALMGRPQPAQGAKVS